METMGKAMALRLSAFLLLVLVAQPGWAGYMINDGGTFDGTDVGGLDTLLGETDDLETIGYQSGIFNGASSGCSTGPGNSTNPAHEDCWASANTGLDLDFSDATKTETVTAYTTDGANIIAFQLNYGAGHYLIKNTSNNWAILENKADFGWGVLDWSLLKLSGWNISDTQLTISHVVESPGTSVPEPGSLALLGFGLLALAGFRRRFAG